VLMASAAARLTKLGGTVADDEAYTAGLLADVGVLIFAQYQPKIYLPAFESCFHGPELMIAERELFDTTHPELGARFLARWGLPAPVVAAVSGHHTDPAVSLAAQVADGGPVMGPESDTPLAAAMRVADLFAAAIVDPTPVRVRAATSAIKREFDVADPRMLAEQVIADLGDAPDLFGVAAQKTDAEAALAAFAEPVAVSA
nr:HDOD domain-containing protein [Planctomycetota bacterium]